MKYQVAIIGGGPAGYTAAAEAGKAGCSVILFEKSNLGGVCLNEGCIPTKSLLYSAKVYDAVKQSAKYGVTTQDVTFDMGKMITRKSKVVRKLVLGIKAKLANYHVTVVTGEATIIDAHTVACAEERYECDNLLICTGSETVIPSIPGLEQVAYWTHREALDSKELPASLIILGGGVIGMEFASLYCSLGVQVTVIEKMDEIVGGVDKEIAALLRAEYTKKGVCFLLDSEVISVAPQGENVAVTYKHGEEEEVICAEKLLVSVGRKPVLTGFGLENLLLDRGSRNQISVNKQLQSSLPNVYICGDANGISLLAHTAVRQAEVAVHTILGKKDGMSYFAIPNVVYTNPEVAGVGMTEEKLKTSAVLYNVTTLPLSYSGRFVAENEGANGVCKVITSSDGVILGVHILGNPASELIVLAGIAIEQHATINDWKRYVFPHPTVGEIFKEI
ncbi:MAG: dihydrolipoyl dehydrogenase [Phocaeicola sp.]